MNTIVLTGRLVAEPEHRTTTGGTSVCEIRVAVDRPWTKEERKADFFSAVAFSKTAEFIFRNFHKGSAVALLGTMQNNQYEDKEGKKKDKWQILIDKIEFNGKKTEEAGAVTESAVEESNDDDGLPF